MKYTKIVITWKLLETTIFVICIQKHLQHFTSNYYFYKKFTILFLHFTVFYFKNTLFH